MMLDHDARRLLEAAHSGEAVAERVRVYDQGTDVIAPRWIIKVIDHDPGGGGLRQIPLATQRYATDQGWIARRTGWVVLTQAGERAWLDLALVTA